MASLRMNIRAGSPRTISVEMNADRFERMAANFGLFSPAFLESVDRAEHDVKAGRVRKIRSLADLER